MAKYSRRSQEKVEINMKEMKQGKLHSGRSGQKVTNPKQAIAIGLSEARKEGAKLPYKAGKVPKKSGATKSAIKKSGSKKSASKKLAPTKSDSSRSAPKKSPAKRIASKRGRSTAKKRGSGRSAGSSAAKRSKTGRRGRSGA